MTIKKIVKACKDRNCENPECICTQDCDGCTKSDLYFNETEVVLHIPNFIFVDNDIDNCGKVGENTFRQLWTRYKENQEN